jgi:hypothetical protein
MSTESDKMTAISTIVYSTIDGYMINIIKGNGSI